MTVSPSDNSSDAFSADDPTRITVPDLTPHEKLCLLFEGEPLIDVGVWVYLPEAKKEIWSPGLRRLFSPLQEELREETLPELFEYLPALEQDFSHFLRSDNTFFRRRLFFRGPFDFKLLMVHAEKVSVHGLRSRC